MANSSRENLLSWLRDAHAMEVGTLDNLRRLVGRMESYPQFKARLEQHIRETEGQEQRLKLLLEGMGGSTSTVKETVTRLAGNVQALVGALFSDEMVKNAIAAYAVTTLQENLREEEQMARWLEEHLPEITRQYLQLEETGQGGKT